MLAHLYSVSLVSEIEAARYGGMFLSFQHCGSHKQFKASLSYIARLFSNKSIPMPSLNNKIS